MLKMRLTRKSDSSEMVWFVDHEKNDIELEPCGLCYQTGPCLYIRQNGHPGWEGSKCRGFCEAIGEEPAEQCKECEQWCCFDED